MPAPTKRGKGKINIDYGLNELYANYLDYCGPTLTSKFAEPSRSVADKKLFKQVLKSYFDEWKRLILYESERYTMPFGMGDIRVRKKKMNISKMIEKGCLKMDYGYWLKTGKKVFFLNPHRNGFKYNIQWDKKTRVPVIGKFPYYWRASRAFSRELVKILKYDQSIDYAEGNSK